MPKARKGETYLSDLKSHEKDLYKKKEPDRITPAVDALAALLLADTDEAYQWWDVKERVLRDLAELKGLRG